MFKIKIISIGKVKDPYLENSLKKYEKRLSREIRFDWTLEKNLEGFQKSCEKESFYICLDERGKQMNSIEWSKTLFDFFEKKKGECVFVIGGAEGIPSKILEKASFSISFSKMTFPHQIVRLLLLEQIYRAVQIDHQHPYHK